MTVTVNKMGTGTAEDPYRPETDTNWWEVKEERDNEFVIEILGG